MTDKANLIAKYNDEFRSNLGNPHKSDSKVKGKYVMSHGIANLVDEPVKVNHVRRMKVSIAK